MWRGGGGDVLLTLNYAINTLHDAIASAVVAVGWIANSMEKKTSAIYSTARMLTTVVSCCRSGWSGDEIIGVA